ncbi:MAG: Ig-like, group 2 [Acidobacteriaceae bacterium]|nr:Ig-like, group 2 [Acidobacteriaceae bacterium]
MTAVRCCRSISLSSLVGLLVLPLLIAGCGATSSTITTKTVTAMSVAPDSANIAIGKTQQYTATAKYVDGTTADVTGTATWKTADAAVGIVNGSGLGTAVTAGSTNVTATLSGISGSATLTVPAAPKTLTSIAVTPSSTTIAIGSTAQFSASATYSDGSTTDVTATATWASATPGVATINASGLATAISAGPASLTASMAGVTGTATLTVAAPTPPPVTLTSIAVTPATATVQLGAKQQFSATATYSDGSTANVSTNATWASATPAVATVSAAGLATGLTAGTTAVTATVSGVTGTATLTVAARTVTGIAVTPATASVGAGAMQPFIAIATYSDQTTTNVTATATWTSANPALATVNAAGMATGVAPGSTQVTAAIGSISGSATLTVKAVSSIAITPTTPSLAIGGSEQLTATATFSDATTGNVTSSVKWSMADPTVATISASGLAAGVASGATTVTAMLGGTTATVSVVVTTQAAGGTSIPTWHVDTNRSGLNAQETTLAPSNVTPQSFGKKFSYLVDGYAYAEPLLISNVTVNGSVHNVLYVATEADTVYAFDADTYGTGTPLWKVSLLQGDETPITDASIQPYDGITSTPVIDAQSNTMYVVSTHHSSTKGSSFRLNALDITTGAQKFNGPFTIQASVPATNLDAVNGVEHLTTSCIQRAALLLANGNVYIGFGSCHSGWLLAYDAHTLTQVGVFNASPNLNGEGKYASAGGVWMGGGGPAADASGNIYVTTGNGPWDGQKAFGDSVIRFSPTLQLLDYFTPQDYLYMNCQDSDLAAGGLLLIPGTTQALAGGKMGRLYLVNTTNLGHEQVNDAGVTQTLFFESDLISPYSNTCTDPTGGAQHTATVNSYEIFGTAAFFNGSVYLGITPTSTSAPAGVRQFAYANGVLTPGSYTSPSVQQNTRGTTPFISANGTSNGILWMIDTGQPLQTAGGATTATLRAYDAVNLSNQIYNSGTNSADAPGFGIKFSSPVVANGKVYISTGHDPLSTPNPHGEIDVYGLR